MNPCSTCNGTGVDKFSGDHCIDCDGTGDENYYEEDNPCDNCPADDDICRDCPYYER